MDIGEQSSVTEESQCSEGTVGVIDDHVVYRVSPSIELACEIVGVDTSDGNPFLTIQIDIRKEAHYLPFIRIPIVDGLPERFEIIQCTDLGDRLRVRLRERFIGDRDSYHDRECDHHHRRCHKHLVNLHIQEVAVYGHMTEGMPVTFLLLLLS